MMKDLFKNEELENKIEEANQKSYEAYDLHLGKEELVKKFLEIRQETFTIIQNDQEVKKFIDKLKEEPLFETSETQIFIDEIKKYFGEENEEMIIDIYESVLEKLDDKQKMKLIQCSVKIKALNEILGSSDLIFDILDIIANKNEEEEWLKKLHETDFQIA